MLDGFTNQARRYIERDREPDKAEIPEPEKETSGQNVQKSEPENKISDGDRALMERLAEMSVVVKICGALSMKDVVGWNEDTGEVAIQTDERRLEGKAVYDALFLEAADYVLMQSISGNTEKAVEMDRLLKEAQKYAARYDESKQQREENAVKVSQAELKNLSEEPEQEITGRFSAAETSDAFTEPYAVWDNENQNYYVAGDGTVPTFATQKEASAYADRINEISGEKEAVTGQLPKEEQAEPENIEPIPETDTEKTEQPGTEDIPKKNIADTEDDFPDIDTNAVRERLAKAGIVDGQPVDENALENDPFIQQVMRDVETLTGETDTEPEKASEKEAEKSSGKNQR